MLGLDYSQGRPTGAAVRAAGYGFVARYLDNGLAGRTNLTAAEAQDMWANGVAVALVWESTANRATQGRDAGVADAHAADVAAIACGCAGLPIYFVVDFDIPDYAPAATSPLAKLGPVGDYFAGVVSVLGTARTGVYGGFYAVSRTLDAGLASWAWQTMAWSGNQVDTRIHLLQRLQTVTVGGVSCDVNEARQTEYGQDVAGTLPARQEDIVFQFIANTDSPLQTPGQSMSPTNGPTQVIQLVGGGLAVPATWADVHAKDKAWGGDGTGSVLGVGAAQYQHFVDTDTAVRTAFSHLATLTSGGGAAGATADQVQGIVDGAFADHNATLTYNKITGA